MPEIINIYCDESCHLENDHQKVMVWSGLVAVAKTAELRRLTEIKTIRIGPRLRAEVGQGVCWALDYYTAVLDWF